VISRAFGAAARAGRRLSFALAIVLGATLNAGAMQVHAQQGPAPGAAHQGASSASSGAAEVKGQGSYSLGVLLGLQLRKAGLTASAVSFERVLQGLKDVTSGKVEPSEQDSDHVRALIAQSQAAAAATNKAAAHRFLAENSKRKGVKTTSSGLQYKVLSAGNGASPHPTDQVTVNYRGTLLDGTEFDSSYKRGEPATFPVNGVIPGWTEALVMMKPGAKWELYIPPDLAYGDHPPPQIAQAIPPGSLLKFEVELLKVTPGGSPGSALPNVGGGKGR
jgi:FKBP-type peptidyl-prolyl cis-trans isomerase FklB